MDVLVRSSSSLQAWRVRHTLRCDALQRTSRMRRGFMLQAVHVDRPHVGRPLGMLMTAVSHGALWGSLLGWSGSGALWSDRLGWSGSDALWSDQLGWSIGWSDGCARVGQDILGGWASY